MSKPGSANWQDKLGPQDSVTFADESPFKYRLTAGTGVLVISDAVAYSSDGISRLSVQMPTATKQRLDKLTKGKTTTVISALVEMMLDELEKRGETLWVERKDGR